LSADDRTLGGCDLSIQYVLSIDDIDSVYMTLGRKRIGDALRCPLTGGSAFPVERGGPVIRKSGRPRSSRRLRTSVCNKSDVREVIFSLRNDRRLFLYPIPPFGEFTLG
jgi:hypothetical protein